MSAYLSITPSGEFAAASSDILTALEVMHSLGTGARVETDEGVLLAEERVFVLDRRLGTSFEERDGALGALAALPGT